MSLTTDQIKKFVETDWKDYTILVTCDNEHKFFHRSKGMSDIVWDWENECFTALETQEDVDTQMRQPMQVTTVSFGEIQFLTAYIDMPKALEFVKEKYTEEGPLNKAKSILQRIKPAMGTPESLRDLTRTSRSPYPNN